MKKLFNVRDFMFDAADVQKLGHNMLPTKLGSTTD